MSKTKRSPVTAISPLEAANKGADVREQREQALAAVDAGDSPAVWLATVRDKPGKRKLSLNRSKS